MIQVESCEVGCEHLDDGHYYCKADETHMGINETLEAMDANSKQR